nr:EAL domain-containing protein [Echinimonas agarilytica]
MTRNVLHDMPVMLRALNADGTIVSWNAKAQRISGFSHEEMKALGDDISTVFVPYPPEQLEPHLKYISHTDGMHLSKMIRKDGEARRIAWYTTEQSERVPGWSKWEVGIDLTKRFEYQDKLEQMAMTDSLTELPNRRYLQSQISQLMSSATVQTIWLVNIDLDNFKIINETMGHSVGDGLLIESAHRITSLLSEGMWLCRTGGDEFGLLIEGGSKDSVEALVLQIMSAMTCSPFDIADNKITTSVSMGGASSSRSLFNEADLINNSETAMYAAKANGRNGYQFYSDELSQEIRRERQLIERLTVAVADSSFELFYQPQIELSSKRLIGVEALIRWSEAPPSEFIPLAEKNGLINQISEWVLKTACQQISDWRDQGFECKVSINLSAVQFYQAEFDLMYADIIDSYNLPPDLIGFEITEGTLIRNIDDAIATVSRLSDRGFEISLDDFGTGYSSFSYLKNLPAKTIKIDKSFIDDLATSDLDANLVSGMISMVHSLDMKVLAEGVETTEQLQLLKQYQCDSVQGFVFSEAKNAKDFFEWLQVFEAEAKP